VIVPPPPAVGVVPLAPAVPPWPTTIVSVEPGVVGNVNTSVSAPAPDTPASPVVFVPPPPPPEPVSVPRAWVLPAGTTKE